MEFEANVNGVVYSCRGELTAIPIAHAFSQVVIPTTDGIGENAYEGSTSDRPTAIIVLVHSFSGSELEITVDPALSAMLSIPDAAIVCPHLFGGAGNPNTCGSPAQLAHLNDVINWMQSRYGAGGKRPVFFSGV